VWTGSEMIIWGGRYDTNTFNDGARYSPAANTWSPLATNGAPSGRNYHSAVWTGTQMIIWGGAENWSVFNDGGRYDPKLHTWTSVTTNAAPSERVVPSAIWTGTEMIVWGGTFIAIDCKDSGGRYNPATDSWTPLPSTILGSGQPPSGRDGNTAIWTGSEMIV